MLFNLFSKSSIDIDDPCFEQIIQFVRAVSGIKEKELGSAWIDFYTPPLDVEIVCRYYEHGGLSAAAVLYQETHSNEWYPSKDGVIKVTQERFNDITNIDSFPYGTQVEITNEDGNYEITFSIVPLHKNLIKKYRGAVSEAIKKAGLNIMDSDERGSINPSRIYIEYSRKI